MAVVVFLFQVVEVFLELPGEDVGFGEEAGPAVGFDDTGFALGRDSAVGFASVLAGRSDLLLGAHGVPFGK